MSTRACYDWSPLGFDHDPVPGDPDAVEDSARAFRVTAECIGLAAGNLRNLSSPATCSEAVDALLRESRELADKLSQVGGRYSAAAGALSRYAPELSSAQAKSVAALEAAAEAANRRRSAQHDAQGLLWQWRTATDEIISAEYERQFYVAKAHLDSASSEVASARQTLLAAIEKRDTAADTAADCIEEAVRSSPVNDSAFDRFKEVFDAGLDLLEKVGKWIWDNIDTIALVLTVVAIAVAFIPGVNVLSPALLAIARGATLLGRVKAFADVGLGVVKGLRTGNWSQAVTGAFGLLPGSKLGKTLGKGLSKVLGKRLGGLFGMSLKEGDGWAGKRAKTLLGKLITAQDGHLARQVKGSVASMSQAVRRNGVTRQDIARRIDSGVLPASHRQDVHSLLSRFAESGNLPLKQRVDEISAIAGLSKGSDYLLIKDQMDSLAGLSRHVTITGDAAREMVDLAGIHADRQAGKASDWVTAQARELVGSGCEHKVPAQRPSVGAP